MAGAVNIPIGVTVSGLLAGFRQGSQAVGEFTSQFKAQFNGLKGSTDAPAGALASLTRQFNIARREISDIIAVGGQPTAELANRFALLQNSINAVKGAFATPVAVTAFQSLQARLTETKGQIQDLLAKGEPVPAALAQKFRLLESQVNSVNREFAQTPTRLQQIGTAGQKIAGVGLALSALSAGVGFLGVSAFKSYADVNALLLGLENITGTAEGAKRRFAELAEVARLPGLGLQEAVQGDVRLQAVGFSAEKSKNILLEFGNALALTGGGKFELGNVITQLTQMGSKAKVLAEDLKPILTSSPAVAKAIKQMFGTVDSEQISSKLQAAGQGPQEFISNLVLKLSELERVKGGPKNAIENISDAILKAKFNFGEAADKAFNLTGIIDRLGNLATRTAESFGALSPGIQKGILVTAGFVAVAGPLLLAFGSIAAIAPSVVAGITLITGAIGIGIGPILLIGAAIAGAAILIVSNWDTIKKTLTDAGIWQSVTGLVTSAFDTIKGVFVGITDAIGLVWSAFGTTLVTYGRSFFNLIAGVFNAGLGFLSGTFQLFGGILTGNWSKALGGLVTAGKAILGGLLSIFQSAFGAIGSTLAGLLRLGGAGSLADTVLGATKSGVDALGVYITKLRGVEEQAKKTSAALVAAVKPAPTAKPFDYSKIDLGGSAFEKAKDQLKKLKDEIASGILAGKDVSGLQAQYDVLKAKVDGATESFKKQRTAIDGNGVALTTNESILKRLTRALKEQGDSASDSLKGQVALFRELVQNAKDLSNIKPVDLGDKLKPISQSGNFASAFSALTAGSAIPILPGLSGLQDRISAPLDAAKAKLKQFNIDVNGILREGALSAFEGMGNVIGGLISGTQGIESLPGALLGTLGGVMKQLGQLALQTAIGITAIQVALKTLNPVVAAVAGVALIALGSAIQSSVKQVGARAFKDGGIISGPTLGLVGEYAGARNNPEVIAPLDKLKGMIGGRGGVQTVFNDIVIDGAQLRVVLNRADEIQSYH